MNAIKLFARYLAIAVISVLLLGACASASGYHKSPPAGGKFKCK